MLLHFHLTKDWFYRVKSGKKDVEFRECHKFSEKRICLIKESLFRGDLFIRFYLGYPSREDTSRYFDCRCVKIDARYLVELPNLERNFFVNQGCSCGLFYGFHVVRIWL